MPPDNRLLIAHVIFRLDVGGLENGLVNLINGLPKQKFRHAIICIDEFSSFKDRIDRDDVELIAIGKKPGHDPQAIWRIIRVLRRLKPDIVHTRNLAGLDGLLPALIAGVRVRIHGEHGWDVADVEGDNKRARILRKIHSPLVRHYVALSREIHAYLVANIGVAPEKITQIINGVDTDSFRPSSTVRTQRHEFIPNVDDDSVIIGTVGRLQAVKDPLNLVESVVDLRTRMRDAVTDLRLVIVGDGPLFAAVRNRLDAADLASITWLPGARSDIPRILQSFDVFVQPSRAEGISNTILEAMASQLPVIATDVGGNSELVVDGDSGFLTPPENPGALSAAIERYLADPPLRIQHGKEGRARAVDHFGLRKMVRKYELIYETLASRER